MKNDFPFKMPLSAFGCKYDAGMERGGHGFIGGAVNSLAESKACPTCEAPLKQCRDISYYYLNSSNKPKPIRTKKEIYIYHGTERATKRAKDSALYSYTSICNGEMFLGWMSGEKDQISSFWKLLKKSDKVKDGEDDSKLQCNLRIGRAKKRRGYLKCTMKLVTHGCEPETVHPLFYSEAYPSLRDDGLLIIVLQTPAIILCNELFRPVTTFESDNIFSDCSFKESISKQNDKEFSATSIIDGWSGIHRLPRVPDVAISEGSTFSFKLENSSIDDNAKRELENELAKIQASGIGERKNEGYGQILINPPFHRGEGKWRP